MLNYQLDNILLFFSLCMFLAFTGNNLNPAKNVGCHFQSAKLSAPRMQVRISECFSLFDTNRSKTCTNNASSNIYSKEPHLLWRQRYAMVLAGFFSCQRSPCLETQPDSKYLCRVFQPKKWYLALVLLAYIWWKSVGVLDWRASCLCPPCPRWRWGTAARMFEARSTQRKPKLASMVLNAWSQISAMLAFHSKTVKSSGVGPKPKSKRAKTWT